MTTQMRQLTLLMADDDEDDRLMAKDALEGNLLANDLRFVEDGEALMDYLRHRGPFKKPESSPRPGLILLDLNMPRKSGREALQEIKSDPDLKDIPIVILTSSREEQDVYRSYELGVNSFIVKPVTFQGLMEVMKTLEHYWLEIVELPTKHEHIPAGGQRHG